MNGEPDELPGVVLPQYVRCSKPSCRCNSRKPEDLHGPYFYRFFRAGGRLRKTYVPRHLLDDVRAACRRRQQREREQRHRRAESQTLLRSLREQTRQLERALEELKRQGVWTTW